MSWLLPETVTRKNALTSLDQGTQAIQHGDFAFDCAPLKQFDSSVLALMLAWQRTAQAQNQRIIFQNVPDKLAGLAQVYGINKLLAP